MRHGLNERMWGAIVTCVVVALGVLASPALGATGDHTVNEYLFAADPGETNHVTMTNGTIRDTGVPVLTAGFGCNTTADPQLLSCPGAVFNLSSVNVFLGDGDDAFALKANDFGTDIVGTINPGPGRDLVEGANSLDSRIQARDGEVDTIRCGIEDLAVVDVEDQLSGCRFVDLPGIPDTAITSGPPPVSADTHPTFTVASSEPADVNNVGAGAVQCRLDDEPFGLRCLSPITFFQSLADGPHVFEARAIDPGGEGPDPTPARYAFVIDTAPNPLNIAPLPLADRDGDSVVDASDLCPDRPGAGPPTGCPARGSTGPDQLLLTALSDVFGAGAGDDRIWGLGGDDRLCGEAGADRLSGGPGDDRLIGDDCGTRTGAGGGDVLSGGDGNDRLSGGPGQDRLWGGAGNDVLVGGPDRNGYWAGAGADDVRARNGRRETIDCGPGHDVAHVDRSDRVRHCERVLRRN